MDATKVEIDNVNENLNRQLATIQKSLKRNATSLRNDVETKRKVAKKMAESARELLENAPNLCKATDEYHAGLCRVWNGLPGTGDSAEHQNGDFVWKNADSPLFFVPTDGEVHTGILDCPIMKIGKVCKWSIFIENVGEDAHIGIVSSAHILDLHDWFGHQLGGWCYWSGGNSQYSGTTENLGLAKLGKGRITLTLNLSNVTTTGGGKLTASIEKSSREIILFDNLFRDSMGLDVTKHGFYPAVCGKNGSCLVFLAFSPVEAAPPER